MITLFCFRDHIMQDETIHLIYQESEEGTTCNSECSLYKKTMHYHCKMVNNDDVIIFFVFIDQLFYLCYSMDVVL